MFPTLSARNSHSLVEPLEQVIDQLKEQLRTRHILRMQKGDCSIDAGFAWSDLLTNLERTADHCSNIAGCVIDIAHGNMDIFRKAEFLVPQFFGGFQDVYGVVRDPLKIANHFQQLCRFSAVTAMISSVGANKNAKRAALVHLSFNIIGTAVWLAVFCVLKAILRPAILDEPASRLGIAVAHSVFNVLCTLLMLPLSNFLEKLVTILVPAASLLSASLICRVLRFTR